MDMCTITQATFTSTPPRALRQGLSIDKQNCLHNSALICGTEAFNVKSNSFRVNWSLTACLDVLFNASGGPGSRRTDAGLQTGRLYVLKNNNNPSACPSKMQRAEVHRRKQQLCFFSPPCQCGGTLCNRLKLGVSPQRGAEQSRAEPSRAEPSRAEASNTSCKKKKKRKRKIKDGVWPLKGHAEVLLNRSCYGSCRRSQHFIFIAVMFNQLPWELGHPPRPPSSSSISISILHSEPPSLLTPPTQRGPPWDVNRVVN